MFQIIVPVLHMNNKHFKDVLQTAICDNVDVSVYALTLYSCYYFTIR